MIISPAKATYRYSFVIQGAVLLPILIFAFVGYVSYSDLAESSINLWLLGALIVAALACLILFVYLNKQRVFIHEEGIVEQRLFFREKQIEWSDVKETRYKQTALAQDMLMHFGILGALVAPFVGKNESSKKGIQELKIVSRTKVSITFSNYFKNVREAIRAVLERVNPPYLASARTDLQQGKEVVFGDLVLTSSGIRFKKKEIAYTDIESAKISGRDFRVKQSGKWLDAVAVPSQKIPNIFVAIDLIEEKCRGAVLTDKTQSSMAATV